VCTEERCDKGSIYLTGQCHRVRTQRVVVTYYLSEEQPGDTLPISIERAYRFHTD